MEKQKVLMVYLNYLDRKIRETEKALDSIYEGVYTAPKPSESHSDTTRSQQSRVALGTAARLSSLKKIRASTSVIFTGKSNFPEVGALIILEDVDHKEKEYYFIVLEGGGESIDFEGMEILFVSIHAPILETILRANPGDFFEFKQRKLVLVEIL